MHKRILNELALVVDISPAGAPLLIKSGREGGTDPTLPDMNFVRSTSPIDGMMTVFLPGSSLKGALRAYCERVARSVRAQTSRAWCCNPFDDSSCGKASEKIKDSAERYARACVACRMFGNTRMGSHVRISDAYPVMGSQIRLEQRDGVAIDRISGAVSAGPFNSEVVTQGTFRTTLTMRNYQLWQVGLLAIALRDLQTGRVPIGYGKSKGFGRVSLAFQEMAVAYPGKWQVNDDDFDFAARLYDLSSLVNATDRKAYDLLDRTGSAIALAGQPQVTENGTLGRVEVRLSDPALIEKALLAHIGEWRAAVEASAWPQRN